MKEYLEQPRVFDDPAKVEDLKVFFAKTHPMSDRLQYLELKAQGFSNSAIKKLTGVSNYQLGNIRTSIRYWASRLEEAGKLVPLRRKKLGETREKDATIAHCKISLKNELHSKRLQLFLISQDVQCAPIQLKSGLMTTEILITDDLGLAAKTRSFVILIADCFESLPEIKLLVGCIAVPFSFEFVAAYVKKIFSRVELQIKTQYRIIRFGDFEVDQDCFRVKYQKQEILLTAMEFRIVERLIKSRGETVSYSDISVAAWGDNCRRSRPLNVQIYNIRQKGIPIQSFRYAGYAIGCL